MEARRFGFDPSAPPACKFDPTDADVVAHYLLPRAAGVPDPPFAHAVIDDDTCSCPPWELLRRHGHDGSDHAFFLGPPSDPSVRGGRACRAVRDGDAPGGVWRGQKGVESDLLVARGGRGGGAQLRLRFRRYYLSYYRRGDPSTSGWAMHEYHILQPKLLPGAVLSRIWITGRAKKERKKQQQAAAAAAKKASPGPDQPGPSSNYLVDDHAAGNAAAAVASEGVGTSSGAQSGVVHQEDGGSGGGVVGKMAGGYYTNFLNAGVDGDGCFYTNFLNTGDSADKYFNPDQPGPGSGCSSTTTPPETSHHGGGIVGETTGGCYTNFLNAGEGHGCSLDDGNDYFKEDSSCY